MSILAYAYLPDISGTNTELGHKTNPALLTEPPATPLTYDVGGLSTENWYYRLAYDAAGATPKSANSWTDSVPVIMTEFPALSTELWIRFFDIDKYPTSSYYTYWRSNREGVFAIFWNITAGVKKMVGKLYVKASTSDGNLYYNVYGDDGTTVVKTHIVSTAALFRSNATTKELIADFRFFFDKVAGIIQHYDGSATRVAEVLGQTLNNLPVTHISVYSDQIAAKETSYMNTVFRIVANEPTFGMYVMPFHAKAEGSDQQHLAGNYTRFSMGRKNFTTSGGVTLEKPTTNENVMYSYTPKTLSEHGLPANYNVLSVQVNAVMSGITATGDPIAFSTYLKQKSTGTRYEIPGQTPIKNNVDYGASSQPQIRTARWDKNPVTGQNWQPGDFSDFEIGFKI